MDQFAEVVRRRGRGGPARLPVARLAADRAAARPRARRLPHRVAAPSRRLGVQPAAQPVRGRGRRAGRDRPGDPEPARRDARGTRRRRATGSIRSPSPRAEHVVAENARVGATVDGPAAGDLRAVGRLFAESHASLRDQFEVSSPELDAMVEIARAVPGVVATRMTGAGFGGCTVNLVRPDAVEALRDAVERDYPRPDRPDPDGPAGPRRRTVPAGCD